MTAMPVTLPWSERPPLRRLTDVVVLGLAASIATGLVHALALEISHIGFDRMVWYPRGFFWMSPIAYTIALLPGVLILGLAALTIRRGWFLAFAIFAFGTAGAFGLLLPFTQISRTAALVLSAGIGTTLSRIAMKRSERVLTWSKRLAALCLVVLPVAALFQNWSGGSRTSTATTEAANQPNILLVVMDVVRARNVTLNEPTATTTPALQRRAAESVVFDWAFSSAPWTLPSHASMFTGLYPRQQAGDWYKPLQREARTLTEILRERGYATGGFVANLHYTSWDTGLAQGFEHYSDYATDWLQVIRCSSYTQTELFTQLLDAHSVRDVVSAFVSPNLSIIPQHTYRTRLADHVVADFLAWQDGLGTRPFFAFLNLMDAHLAFYDSEPIRSRYPPRVHRGERDYNGAIGFIDVQLDSMVKALERKGVLDNTILVVTADHGELFDQHGLSGHANSLYLDLLHVPLMIRYPGGVPANMRVTTPVSLRDLAATLLDLSKTGDSLPGASLRHTWEGEPGQVSPVLAEVTRIPNVKEPTPASQGDMRALFDDSTHYIVNEGTGREELYAYRTDRMELHNLAEGDSAAERLALWRERLARVLRDVRVVPPNGKR